MHSIVRRPMPGSQCGTESFLVAERTGSAAAEALPFALICSLMPKTVAMPSIQ
jgi:hypothetical protein